MGGASILGGTQAFSQIGANRAASVGTAGDGEALLGLDTASEVQAGIDDQYLVEVTNNTDESLEVAVSLTDSAQGSLTDATGLLEGGESRIVSISVAFNSQTGAGALPFEITAVGEDLDIALSRSITVVEPPALKQQVRDQTQNGNAAFSITYRVSRLPDFEEIEIDVENADAGHIDEHTYTETSAQSTITYPPGGGHDGGAGGDTYEFRFRVYDGSGEYDELSTEFSLTADGDNPPGDDLGDEDDPKLAGFTVENEVQNTNNRFTVDYEIDQLDEFEEVSVLFDNTQNSWSDRTITDESAPTGTVVYPGEGQYQGGVNGDTFEVSLEVYNIDGIPVDGGSVTIDAGSNETVQWSE